MRRRLRSAAPVRGQPVHPGPVPCVVRLPGRAYLRRAVAHLPPVRRRRRVQHRSVVRRIDGLPVGRLRDGRLPRLVGDCPTGQLCGSRSRAPCGGCSTDAQCTADPQYGPGNICFQGICQPGNCHGTSTDCRGAQAGLLCGAQAANACGACAADSQCQADPAYGSGTICNTTTGQPDSGKCVSSACTGSGACAANAGDFCCGGSCTPGNCCADADCAPLGSVYRCVNNSCTGCSPATGNKFFVDPVNGSDSMATGSGMVGSVASPACSFRTVTRALAVGRRLRGGGDADRHRRAVGADRAARRGRAVADHRSGERHDHHAGGADSPQPTASADPNLGNVAGFQLAGDPARRSRPIPRRP